MDGTLVDHDLNLAPSIVRAVRDAHAAGHLTFLNTGRSRSEIPAKVAARDVTATVHAGPGDRFHVITGTMPAFGEAGGEVTLAGINKNAVMGNATDEVKSRADDVTTSVTDRWFPGVGGTSGPGRGRTRCTRS